MPSIKYLRTGTSHEIPNFIRYLAFSIVLFLLTSVEAENMFIQLKKTVKTKLFTHIFQNLLSALIRIRGKSNSFEKIKETAVDKLRNTNQRII